MKNVRKRASPAHGSHGSRVKKTDFSVSGTTGCDRLSALNRPLRATTAPVGSTKAEMPVFVERAIQRRCSTARRMPRERCCSGAEDRPNHASLLMFPSSVAPWATCLRASSGKMDS